MNGQNLFTLIWSILLFLNPLFTYSQVIPISGQKNNGKTVIVDTTVTYVVRPGDSLWEIAKMSEDNPFKWREIYNRNRNTIVDPNILAPGQKILIRVPIAISSTSVDSLPSTSVSKPKVQKLQIDSAKAMNSLNTESLGIGDLVIDRTRSRWGRDFVDLFNKSWNPPENINDYTIVIEERPLPRLGTVILIKVNGNYIYKRFVQPRYESIKINAKQGTEMALSYLEHYKQIQKDLEGEDLKGTGIY